MRQSRFQFRIGRGQSRGLPGALIVVIGAVLVAGIVALVIFLGTLIAVAGLIASTAAALYFGARRLLSGKGLFSSPPASSSQRIPQMHSHPVSPSSPLSPQVREIDVEVLPDDKP